MHVYIKFFDVSLRNWCYSCISVEN